MDSQDEDKPSTSRRRKKRGRTSESDKAPKKKAKSEDVDALLEETSQSDQTRMDQAKVIDVPQAKKDQFKAKLNEIFMSEHAQVRQNTRVYAHADDDSRNSDKNIFFSNCHLMMLSQK